MAEWRFVISGHGCLRKLHTKGLESKGKFDVRKKFVNQQYRIGHVILFFVAKVIQLMVNWWLIARLGPGGLDA